MTAIMTGDSKARQERLVFVDPEDEEISYWWPAIVVPEEEYELFKETMDNDAGVDVNELERLVCYFEDGSFSVVPKSGLIPFNPQREPYKSYSRRLKNFVTDAGIRRATQFYNEGKIPKMFKWLILGETGYLDPTEIEAEDVDIGAEDDDGSVKVKDFDKGDTSAKVKVKKQHKHHTKHPAKNHVKDNQLTSSKPIIEGAPAKKRGRKPKNQQQQEQPDRQVMQAHNEYPLESPKPVNSSDLSKIDALISAANISNPTNNNSEDLNGKTEEQSNVIDTNNNKLFEIIESRMTLNQESITTASSQ